METWAMPVVESRPPIQVIDGPVKVNEACAPAAAENAAVLPLQVSVLSPCVQPPLYVTAGSFSSKRVDDGGGGGGGVTSFDTFTVTALEVNCRAPSTERATAVSVCGPLLAVAVFHETEYGALVSAPPRFWPSSWNWTLWTVSRPMTVTFALTGTFPDTVCPEEGDDMFTTSLPNSCAWACRGISARQEIASVAIAQTCRFVFFTSRSVKVDKMSPSPTGRDSRFSMCRVDAFGMLRMDCRADFQQRPFVAIHHRFLREQGHGGGARFPPHPFGDRSVGEDQQLVDQRPGIADRKQEAGPSRRDHFRGAADVRVDHRPGQGHRLDRRHGKGLGEAAQHHHVACRNVGAHVPLQP